MNFSYDDFLGGKIVLKQEVGGYRATSDAITIAAAVDNVKERSSILDVGSGTGAISMCLACRFPFIHITGIEIQQGMVDIAIDNAERNGFSERIDFICADISDKETLREKSFDYVVTNPPFMSEDFSSPNVNRDRTRRPFEISLARWLDFCVRKTRTKGELFIIHKPESLYEILAGISDKMGAVKIYPIHSKEGEGAKKIIVHAVKGSRAKLEIEPSLALHDADGKINCYAEMLQKEGWSLKKVLQERVKNIDRLNK